VTGSIKVLKIFGATKGKQVVGGKVISGRVGSGNNVRIIRRENEIGNGKIVELQANKIKAKEVLEGSDCGMLVETRVEMAAGDIVEVFEVKII
jgi:translation initiation factor IF-2